MQQRYYITEIPTPNQVSNLIDESPIDHKSLNLFFNGLVVGRKLVHTKITIGNTQLNQEQELWLINSLSKLGLLSETRPKSLFKRRN